MEVIRNNMAARQTDLRLYLDVVTEVSKVSYEAHFQTLTRLT